MTFMHRIDIDADRAGSAHGLELHVEDHIATITLARPEKRNAMTLDMWRELAWLAAQLDGRDDVRAVVLTGSHDSFCAGADITEFDELRNDTAQVLAYDAIYEAGCRALETLGKPVIAAINGYCMGGGCNLALACDIRFAAPQATFAIPAARLSVVYGAAGTRRLLNLVGPGRARRILFTGARIGAFDALGAGLIDEVHDNVYEAARRCAATMTAVAPLSIRGAKAILAALETASENHGERVAEAAIRRAANSADYVEARTAFREKRAPRFCGH
ncbi:enoyl-CoA hydratase/isomerase family protein [Burkholderia anthina]|uniref:Enoyl-CoA hydratase/isomerase family protein n=2 Tax=Burkholderia anthina TaxID=179879 RepID=A0ABS2B8H7_9BURK|nr:enoyl-CoA hydratase/isomerase family protein [Burkholderia anthina]